MQILHGRARHQQSQGSVEGENSDIKKMLATWMRENKSTKWTNGSKFVQFKKNHSFHTGMKCAPYKATFGIETTGGLVRKVSKYPTILNYVMLVKNMSAMNEAGLNIIEMATSRHDAHSIGKMFDLVVDNYRSLYPNETLIFPLLINDFSWATMV